MEFKPEYQRFEYFGDQEKRRSTREINQASDKECEECRQSNNFEKCIEEKTKIISKNIK